MKKDICLESLYIGLAVGRKDAVGTMVEATFVSFLQATKAFGLQGDPKKTLAESLACLAKGRTWPGRAA